MIFCIGLYGILVQLLIDTYDNMEDEIQYLQLGRKPFELKKLNDINIKDVPTGSIFPHFTGPIRYDSTFPMRKVYNFSTTCMFAMKYIGLKTLRVVGRTKYNMT